MSVNLTKGASVNLSKATPSGTLTTVAIGLGWDANAKPGGDPFDLDASIAAFDASGASLPGTFCFYNNTTAAGGAMKHSGDELTGDTEGDDETITVDLTSSALASAATLKVFVTIHKARERDGGQTFAAVSNAYCRVVDGFTGKEISRFDLSGGTAAGTNALVFAELYRDGDGWAFKAIAAESADELDGLVAQYAIS